MTATPSTSTTSNNQVQNGDSSDEIDAEIQRLENGNDVDTDEDGDTENPNFDPGHHMGGAQLLSQTDHDDTNIYEDNFDTQQNTNNEARKG